MNETPPRDRRPPDTGGGAGTGTGMLQFDSATVAEADRFAKYRELYAQGTDAEQIGPDFDARITAWPPDRVTILERRLNDVGHVRGVQRAGVDRFDHLVLTLVVSGTVEIDVGPGFVIIPPGGGLVSDMRRPGRNRMRHAHCFSVRIARDQFEMMIGPADHLHGRLMPVERCGLLVDYIGVFCRRMAMMPTAAIGSAIDAMFALIAAAIGPIAGGVETVATARDAARLARVRTLIDTHIADPDLGPDMIVNHADLSRATLYRLFKGLGGVTGHIQARRLQRLMLALNDDTEARSFADLALAVGFRSEAHASRLFQQRYGVRPGRYRTDWTAQADPQVPLREMRFLDDNIR